MLDAPTTEENARLVFDPALHMTVEQKTLATLERIEKLLSEYIASRQQMNYAPMQFETDNTVPVSPSPAEALKQPKAKRNK